jgi:fructose-bisphosphate aldolase, class I
MNNNPRLYRLFAPDGKCMVVALDHGLVNEARFLGGIENLAGVISNVAAANPDAMLLGPGQAPLLQTIPGKEKPALVLRADVPNVYREQAAPCLFNQLMEGAVEQALRLDAACVIANLFYVAEQPQVYQECLANISRLVAEGERYGMPVMVEARVMELNSRGGYAPVGDADKLAPLVRQAVELGVDALKVDPTDNPEDFGRVTQVVGETPVLALGGGKSTEEQILARTSALIQQGARGVVYGRNVFEHPNPSAMARALRAIVHEGATPEQAMKLVR